MASTTKQGINRKLLLLSVSALCKEQGFSEASKSALETLTELLQSYISEIAQCTQEYTEICQRTLPDVTDVRMALVDLGTSLQNIESYAKRKGRESLRMPGRLKPPSTQKPLQSVLSRHSRPSYVPGHLPPFPDVHAYVRTPTLRQPVNEYQVIREKYASQRKDTEFSLTRFMARTRPAETQIFENINTKTYPLVHSEPTSVPYLKALLASDDGNESTTPTANTSKAHGRNGFSENSEEQEKNLDSKDNLADIDENLFLKPAKRLKHYVR